MQLQTLDITIPVPAVQGYFDTRLATYSTQIPALQIRRLLGHDPRTKSWPALPPSTRYIYEHIQRREGNKKSETRFGSIREYLLSRHKRGQVAAFPALSVGVTHSMRFDAGPDSEASGILQVSEDGQKILLDGLGRVTACLDFAEESAEGQEIISNIVFPVVMFLPKPEMPDLTVEELGQLFMDFNFRIHPVSSALAVSLDQSDIYISLANELSKSEFIAANGGMQTRSKVVSTKSEALVTQTILIRVVRGATEGREFQESNLATTSNPNLTEATFTQELHSIGSFFQNIANRMGDRWSEPEGLHLTAPGWQALGVLHYDMFHRGLVLSSEESSQVYDAIAAVDWSRKNKAWVDELDVGSWKAPKRHPNEAQVVLSGAGRSNTQAILNFLRQITGLRQKLDGLSVRTKAA